MRSLQKLLLAGVRAGVVVREPELNAGFRGSGTGTTRLSKTSSGRTGQPRRRTRDDRRVIRPLDPEAQRRGNGFLTSAGRTCAVTQTGVVAYAWE